MQRIQLGRARRSLHCWPVSVLALLAATASTASAQESVLRSFQRVTSPVRDAGVYHVATGTWTRPAVASPAGAALVGGTMDTLYACTSPSNYFATLEPGQTWTASGRIPSPSSPTSLWNPAALPEGSMPGSASGCASTYQIDAFRIAYCTDVAAPTQVALAFHSSWNPTCTSSLSAATPDGGPFAISGLPGVGTNVLGCWMVTIDLSASTASFAMLADGDGVYSSGTGDAFGWTFTFPSLTSSLSSTGPLLAGAPSDATSPGSVCHPAHPGVGWLQFSPSAADEAAGYDSRRFDTVPGACAPTYPANGTSFAWPGTPTSFEGGSDMLADDAFRIEGGSGAAPGCYFFGGPASSTPPNGPYSNFHLELFGKVSCGVPLANDDCTTPQAIAGSGPFFFNTASATTGAQGQSEALCSFYATTGIQQDVWYAWTAPSTAAYVVATCGFGPTDTKVAVYAGSGCPSGAAIACNDDACIYATMVTFSATAGQAYTVQMGTFPGAASGPGGFTITPLPAGGSDSCATPQAISGLGAFPFDNTNATTGAEGQGEAICLFAGSTAITRDVWFVWTAPATAGYEAKTCGTTTVNTKMAVYPGSACPAPGSALDCGDDDCGLQTSLAFNAVAGQQFVVQLGSAPGTLGGHGTIVFSPSPCAGTGPVNDACTTSSTDTYPAPTASTVEGGEKPQTVYVDTSGLTPASGTDSTACNGLGRDTWYQWTAPAAGDYEFTACPCTPGLQTTINLYSSQCSCGTPEGTYSTPVSCTSGSRVNIRDVAAGTLYYVQVGGRTSPWSGEIRLSVRPTWLNPFDDGAGFRMCFGDGISSPPTTPCPCGNFGGPGNGCASSFNAVGAGLSASGQIALDNVVLNGSGMNPTGVTIFLKGSAIDPNAFAFGDGISCVGGSLIRLRAVALSGGSASFPVPPETITLSTRGATPVGSGLTAGYLAFYRNAAAAFCPPFTFNASNGWQITW